MELEHDETPAAFGVRGVEFRAFLGSADLYDVVVSHAPFMLETSSRFDTHHVLRRRGTALEAACEFPGGSTSSSSKGIGSMSGTRRVAVERMPEGQTGQQAPRTTSHAETSTTFALASAGMCITR